jgi:hypothetical protein
MVLVVRVGESVDGSCQSGGGCGHLEMIQRDTPAQDHFPAGAVGAVTDPAVVGEQVHCCVIEDPPPRLAVVQ